MRLTSPLRWAPSPDLCEESVLLSCGRKQTENEPITRIRSGHMLSESRVCSAFAHLIHIGPGLNYSAFPLHGTVHFWGVSTGYCTWYFFSTTSAVVPSDPYRYQNVTCKLYWSLIGRRESSLLCHWTCDMRPARFKSAPPATERTQLLFQQTHLFVSATNYLFRCLLRRRSSRW